MYITRDSISVNSARILYLPQRLTLFLSTSTSVATNMQSLTTPASVSKRKQACNSCRQRKKRCDGERPACSLCRKWGLRCDFAVPAATLPFLDDYSPQLWGNFMGDQSLFPSDPASFGIINPMQDPYRGFEMPMGFDMPTMNPLQSASSANTFSLSNHATEADFLTEVTLPPFDTLLSLVSIFFSDYQNMIPCFHEASFYSELNSGTLQNEAPFLLYSICAMAAHLHPDPFINNQQAAWYNQAKFLYDLTPRNANHAIRTIQTALCLICHGMTTGDYSMCWLLLGKAWRQAASLGINKIDSSHATELIKERLEGLEEDEKKQYLPWQQWAGKSAMEKEECRRTLWLLYIMDRNMSWPSGWPSAIAERHFKVDIPVTNAVFQGMSKDTVPEPSNNAPFVRNLNSLIDSTSIAKTPLNPLHYLVVAHVLVGRIAEHIHSLHDPPDTPEYAQECEALDASLLRLRLSLPRAMSSVLEAPPEDRPQVVWLNVILNSMAMLLHYREASYSSAEESRAIFIRAVIAAKNTALIVKDTARISIRLLYNFPVLCSIYFASCILLIHWRLEKDDSCKGDMEIIKLVLDKAAEEYTVLGGKYQRALKRDLERSHNDLVKLRNVGYKGLLADCSAWEG
ncbi:unnamed protein product [Periconia digitata]|uniref:Zn(2)-C6 fungal-type domain-containing protein n=1 Tax=Periconia digitata TaxID=1303443 RepID=A0A9W4XER1_9PLEO|nr:unnamed protein product [Periconia digitata]